jgi:hypothetical protein
MALASPNHRLASPHRVRSVAPSVFTHRCQAITTRSQPLRSAQPRGQYRSGPPSRKCHKPHHHQHPHQHPNQHPKTNARDRLPVPRGEHKRPKANLNLGTSRPRKEAAGYLLRHLGGSCRSRSHVFELPAVALLPVLRQPFAFWRGTGLTSDNRDRAERLLNASPTRS